MDNTFDERRMNKARVRQKKWQERQERSKVSRSEIEDLREKHKELRAKYDAKEQSANQANTVEEGADVFTTFGQLPLSQRTQMGLERGGYKKLTPIQSDTLHLALAGYDILGAAKTGSGKTLCFVIPVLERLFVEHWDAEMGVGALILSPTRELALQIFKVMQVVGYKHVLSAALLTGGRDVMEERKRLHVISIIVGTPGRVLHHFQDDANLVLDNMQMFCMDEADRLLDLGFRDAITNILKYLPPRRQTLLFSATQTTDVDMLAQMALNNARYVSSHAISSSPTPATLCQNFLVLELHQKLDALLMFVKRHPNDKVVVFVSTCNQVKFMYLALSRILKKMRIPSMCLTSKMKQFRREDVFKTFCRCKSAVMFCTDVAARGLDFPLVHWVIQYDCPDSAQTYIHRAGRTARAGARGVCLLFLTPTEAPMLSYLANKNIPLREIAMKPGMMQVSQQVIASLVVQGLKYEAQKAFIAYLRSVHFASNKHVFKVNSIDVDAFAHSLGLLKVPEMSELQSLQRSAKNLPWDVVNYIAKHDKKAAATSAGDSKPLTRKEKHLNASDMFRTLEQKQKYTVRDEDDEDDDEEDFLVKKPKATAAEASGSGEEDATMQRGLELTAEERLAGLSKRKRRMFLETADLRIKDLGLSKHTFIDNSDDDDEEDDGREANSYTTKIVPGAIVNGSDESSDDGDEEDEDAFAQKLRQRVHSSKIDDQDRAKKLRRLRKLQKTSRVSKKVSLEESGVTAEVGGARPPREEDGGDDDSDDGGSSGSDISSNGSLGRLIRAAKGKLYSESDDDDDDDDGGDGEDEDNHGSKYISGHPEWNDSEEDGGDRYHGIDSSDDNEDDGGEVERALQPTLKKTRRN